MEKKMNYYEILQVKKNASQEEIRNSYINLIKKYHPDIYQGDKSFAEKKSKEVNVAYEILSDSEKRAEYDLELESENPSPITYEYTPPKYNNPSAYSYQEYYRNKNAYEFGDYNKRYTDYHRSKTPNSNYSYTNNMNDQFSEKIVNSVNKLNLPSKILIILAILTAYLIIFILTIIKFNSFTSGEEKGTILNNDKSSENISNNTSITNSTIQDDEKTSDKSEEFDVNDYVSEEELRKAYYTYYDNSSDITYSEFRDLVSYYLYYYLYENN